MIRVWLSLSDSPDGRRPTMASDNTYSDPGWAGIVVFNRLDVAR